MGGASVLGCFGSPLKLVQNNIAMPKATIDLFTVRGRGGRRTGHV